MSSVQDGSFLQEDSDSQEYLPSRESLQREKNEMRKQNKAVRPASVSSKIEEAKSEDPQSVDRVTQLRQDVHAGYQARTSELLDSTMGIATADIAADVDHDLH